ncbi:nSTAND1 domain-containing NTPase [Streptomyces gelaticus]
MGRGDDKSAAERAMVRMLHADGVPEGAGVLLGPRHVVTAAHVVETITGSSAPGQVVEVDFPQLALGRLLRAEVTVGRPVGPDGPEDVACLKLLDDPVPGAAPPPIWRERRLPPQAEFQVYGMPVHRDDGLWVDGSVKGAIGGHSYQLDVQPHAKWGILPGYSGGGVWIDGQAAVVALVRSSESKVEYTTAYAIPIFRVIDLCGLSDIVRPPSPYRGLAAFGEADAEVFFGRDKESETVCRRVKGSSLTTVAAHPGMGKSSLVRAGVIPRLRAQGHQVAFLDTGMAGLSSARRVATALAALPSPLVGECNADWNVDRLTRVIEEQGLAGALSGLSAAGPVVMVVDQLEELLLRAPDDAKALFELLLSEAQTYHDRGYRLRILTCLRSDFGDLAAAHVREVTENVFHLHAISADGLRQIVAEPARRVGYVRFSEQVVDQLVEDAAKTDGQPSSGANLPLLQFTAARMWQEAEAPVVQLEDYRRIGGLAKTLLTYVEEQVASLSTAERVQLPRLLTRLVRVGPEPGQDTRATVSADDLDDVLSDLARRLARTALLDIDEDPEGRTTVRLAHDALITRWPLLADWLHQRRDFLVWRDGSLRPALARWQRDDEPEAYLGGQELERGERFAESYRVELDAAELLFIADSRDHATAQARRRRNLRLRNAGVVVALLILAAVLAVILTKVLPEQYRKAGADALASAAEMRRGDDEPAALAQDAFVIHRAKGQVGVQHVLADLLENHGTATFLPAASNVSQAQVAGDRWVLVREESSRFTAWDVSAPARSPAVDETGVVSLAVSEDGRRVATGRGDGAVTVRETGSWRLVGTWRVPESTDSRSGKVTAVALDATGRHLSAVREKSVRVGWWDVASGSGTAWEASEVTGGAVSTLGFTSSGKAVAGLDRRQGAGGWRLWDPRSRRVTEPVLPPAAEANGDERVGLPWGVEPQEMVVGPRSYAVTCRSDRTVLLEPDTGRPVSRFASYGMCLPVAALAGDRVVYLQTVASSRPDDRTAAYDLVLYQGRELWARAAGRSEGVPTVGASGGLLAEARGRSVRVTRLPRERERSDARVVGMRFLRGDDALLTLRGDGTLQRTGPDGRLRQSRTTGLTGPLAWAVDSAESTLVITGKSAGQGQGRAWTAVRYSLPTLTPAGPPILLELPEVSARAYPAILDDGRLVVRQGRWLRVLGATGAEIRALELDGEDESSAEGLFARPGRPQVVVSSGSGNAFQLIDLDRGTIGPPRGPYPLSRADTIIFDPDEPDVAIIAGSATTDGSQPIAVSARVDTGEPVGEPQYLPAHAALDGAGAAALTRSWPRRLAGWSFPAGKQHPKVVAPGQQLDPPTVLLSDSGDRLAVLRMNSDVKVLPADPETWREELCRLTELTRGADPPRFPDLPFADPC